MKEGKNDIRLIVVFSAARWFILTWMGFFLPRSARFRGRGSGVDGESR